jgi:N6-adenosine-specific RNA methylase IME4
LSSLHQHAQWVVADWYLAGCERWGAGWCREIVQSPDWHGVKYDTLRVYASVARKFPAALRYLNCDFSLYQEARSLSIDLAMPLLARAEWEGWGTNRMRIEARRIRCQQPIVGGDVVDDLADLIAKQKKYTVIYADPPLAWHRVEGKRGASDSYYPSMPEDELRALRVPEVATDNAFLFLWCSAAALESSALPLVRAWDFKYKTHAVWDKGTAFGTGSYFRMCHELLLVAMRPATPTHFLDNTIPSIIRAQPTKPHSSKPVETYDIIERAATGPYLELFARTRRKGWDQYGNQLAPIADDHLLLPTDAL